MRVDRQVVINRPVSDVFDFVSDQLNAPRWQKGLLNVTRLTEMPVGVGTRYAFFRKVAGRRIEGQSEYYEYEPNHKVAFRFNSGAASGAGSYEVEPISPDQTRLNSSVELHPTGLARLIGPIMAIAIKRDDDADLATLKRLLESEDGDRLRYPMASE